MERRIILIGKTGNGKSSTGNTLLGNSVFKTGSSLTAVTQICQFRYSFNATSNMLYKVIDTPGLMDADMPLGERLLEILRSVEVCPEPHAFLLIFSSATRMTTDEQFTIDLLRITFGEKVLDHCIIVFTHGGRFNSDHEFTNFWKQSEMIDKLIESCGGRVTRIENSTPAHQGNAVIPLIESLTKGGTIKYQYQHIEAHKKVLQTHIERYDGTGDLLEELSVLTHALAQVLPPDVWEVVLYGGSIIALAVLGAGTSVGVYLVGKAIGTALVGAASTKGGAVAASALLLASRK